LLLSYVLGCTRMQLYLDFNQTLKKEELALFKAFILKRVRHVPIQYILNKSYFRNIELYVDERVLIPRPETELLVDSVLFSITDHTCFSPGKGNKSMGNRNLNILEVGTGSGAIAISLAGEIDGFIEKSSFKPDGIPENIPENTGKWRWTIIATECSNEALAIAVNNAAKILDAKKLANLKFINTDVIPAGEDFFISPSGNRIDIAVSNPPYISRKDYENLPDEVRLFEPAAALIGGDTGLETYERILNKIFPFLNRASSTILFETDPKIVQDLEKLVIRTASENNFKTCHIQLKNDYNGRERVLIARIKY